MLVRCITWKDNVKCLLGHSHCFRVFLWNNRWRKMCLKYSQCMQHLSSLHLCCCLLLSVWNPPSVCLCLSTRCLWWRQPVDNPGQQTAEAYWPSRAKGDFLFFNLSILSSALLSAYFSLPLLLFLSSSVSSHHPIWSLHRSLKLTTNHGEWTGNNINKLTQPNNTFPRTNTDTYVHYTGTINCTQTLTAVIRMC